MVLGYRVVRGPDWNQGDKDGGQHFVGTITEIKAYNCVEVTWDTGEKTTCRVGQDLKYDICMFDSDPRGIRHKYIRCQDCDVSDITGTRWRCAICDNVNLCTPCYYDDCHDTAHPFTRIDYPGCQGVKLQYRSSSQRARTMGLYPDATVTRGTHWEYGDQDGGVNSVGMIEDVVSSDKSCSCRDAVTVTWTKAGSTHAYRVGHKGKVDLCCLQAAPGADYYPSHIACVDIEQFLKWHEAYEVMNVGDRVYTDWSVEELKEFQTHRQHEANIEKLPGEIGIIKSQHPDGALEVQFGDVTVVLHVEHMCLTKIPNHCVGDVVRVIESTEKMQMLQRNHGGWDDEMKQVAGMLGKVIVIDTDGDVGVKFSDATFVFHPGCLIPSADESGTDATSGLHQDDTAAVDSTEESTHANINNSTSTTEGPEFLSSFGGLLFLKKLAADSAVNKNAFVQAVVTNRETDVKRLLKTDPGLKDLHVNGIPCLCFAAHEGFTRIVSVMLDAGADINKQDRDGHSPLEVALARRNVDTAVLLINRGASLQTAHPERPTLLHMSAALNITEAFSLLVEKGCDPNKQDRDGDTPLHLAISHKHDSMAECLIQLPDINTWLKNKRSMNTLAYACFTGHTLAVDKLISRQPLMVNSPFSKSKDGFFPLHIAAVNGYTVEAKLLLEKGHANVNAMNDKHLTPLHLAASEAYNNMAELLISHGAVCTLKDLDGNTPLHTCLMSRRTNTLIFSGMLDPSEDDERLKIAILLLNKHASLSAVNRMGGTPLAGCRSPRLRIAVEIHSRGGQPESAVQVERKPKTHEPCRHHIT